MWLNNCIGEKNYTEFIRFIVIANIGVFFKIVMEVLALIDTKEELDSMIDVTTDLWPNRRFILLIVMISINFIFFACLSELIRFHAYITYHGISTLKYLKLKEEKKL